MDPWLIRLAGQWQLYESTAELTAHQIAAAKSMRVELTQRQCLRCSDCHEEVLTIPGARLHHLLLSHGYRRDGRRFDNHNNYLGNAEDACS
jgi:hypothetical protein